MYKLSKNSERNLESCHIDLWTIITEAIENTQVDFGVSEGHRSVERQFQLFKEGKSKIDGKTRLGKHNYKPSMAVDLFPYVDGKANWSERYLTYLGGVITATANQLKKEGRIKSNIRWGGNWDSDGTIITDQSFVDLPHFELV